jgi:tRNA A-37 threonylcarbamoyl transferase component Bud32
MEAFTLIHADPDFYAPMSLAAYNGAEYRPAEVPPGWTRADDDVWTQWLPGHKLGGVEQGWKIHVSCEIGRAQHVLDTAAAILFARGVSFKHLSCPRFFVVTHHKHAARQQSGKFCVAYPPDQETADQLMTELAEALKGEQGPYVLTDRRYGDSQVVHYRYGAYLSRSRVRLDGSHEMLMRGVGGDSVPDIRGVRFQLPAGLTDPFRRQAGTGESAERPASGGSPSFGGYAFEKVLQHSNAGGAYQARELATGRTVFIKESRAHNGLINPESTSRDRLRHEYRTLANLHQACPGIGPEPIAFFRWWEHEYLVTEFVQGIPLGKWFVANSPIIWPAPTAADFRAYYRRCLHIIGQLSEILRKLHELGYAFVDLNPHNVLIGDGDGDGDGDADSVRLIDFEVAASAQDPVAPVGAPGYFLDPALAGDDLVRYDEYGLSSLALSMIAPLNTTADRNPAVLSHLRHQLDPERLVPDELWALATRCRSGNLPAAGPTPTLRQLDADPAGQLAGLRERLIAGLLDRSCPDGKVPLGPRAYATNELCAAHGLAGVVHALGHAGVPAPELLERLRRESLRDAAKLPPGLDAGLAGIAWVLAENGHGEEAAALLAKADAHPLLPGCATLGQGKAGVGLAHLALYGQTGEEFHLERAAFLADSIPAGDELTEQLGLHNATGLSGGRTGIALLDYYLAGITGQTERLNSGMRLLTADLDRAKPSDGGLLFPVSDSDTRIMPYLYSGTAGVGMVASRFLAATGSERLAAIMPGLVAGVGNPFTYYAGLYAGMAGIGLFLHDHAQRHQDEAAAARARHVAKRMFLYAVPHGAGSWVMGEYGLRMSGDLWCGSAGVLVFLTQFLENRPDGLFTLDELYRRSGQSSLVSPAGRSAAGRFPAANH